MADLERLSLRVRFGTPVRVTDLATVRAILSLRARHELGSGHRVSVFRYPSWESALAYKEFNRLRFPQLRVLGPFDTVLGPVNVLDHGLASGEVGGL